MPWGKFKGKTLEDIPSSYLRWLQNNCEDDEIQEAAEAEYQWRTDHSKHWYD
jgi:hypothetical protein